MQLLVCWLKSSRSKSTNWRHTILALISSWKLSFSLCHLWRREFSWIVHHAIDFYLLKCLTRLSCVCWIAWISFKLSLTLHWCLLRTDWLRCSIIWLIQHRRLNLFFKLHILRQRLSHLDSLSWVIHCVCCVFNQLIIFTRNELTVSSIVEIHQSVICIQIWNSISFYIVDSSSLIENLVCIRAHAVTLFQYDYNLEMIYLKIASLIFNSASQTRFIMNILSSIYQRF